MDKHIATVVRDDGVAGSNPATPTSLRTDTCTDTPVLLHGDCLESMPALAAGSVDMVLADLPYGTTACKWDAVIPFEPLWCEYRRVCKPNAAIVLTASQPFTSALVMSNPDWFKYAWVWEKNRASGHVHAKNKPMKRHEDVLVFSRGTTVHAGQSPARMFYNPQGLTVLSEPIRRRRNDVGDDAVMAARKSHGPTEQSQSGYPTSIISFEIPMNETRRHPTQKPVALMEYLIRTYTNPGDTVLDNTMGSGTTGVACANLGRKFIGIEKDKPYFDIASERIRAALAQPPTLFNAA